MTIRKGKLITVLCWAMLFFRFTAIAQQKATVHYVTLEEGENIPGNPVKEYGLSEKGEGNQTILLYPEAEFQTITGVGGAFNEIGGLALASLPKGEQKRVISNLFGEAGAYFTLCRTAIGSSDFGVDAYSYDETPNDFGMKDFSVDRDKKSVIPFIKLALKYNPDMALFASPWSPPGWMKYSGLMDRGIEFPEKNRLKSDKRIYEAYALYMAKYVKVYKKYGIDIDRILVQNETDISTKYPSCVMPPAQMYEFVSEHMRPAFGKYRLDTEIWAGTFRTHGTLDAIEFAGSDEYLKSVDGIGIQYTNTQYINDMNVLKGPKPAMHTEGVCYNGDNTVGQAFARLGEIASYINSGIPNFCYWNMILDETGKSGWDWKQNSLINIDRGQKTVTYNPDYAVMALFGKYMEPGMRRIASYAHETVITLKKENTVHVFVKNESGKAKRYTLKVKGGDSAEATVPPHSMAVIVLK
ncbi:glycosyl hydrolase [Fulvitalea axinellae]|uniref:Glycosyl hydrolase n=1 Tax=Fulvitalea axinellae TaxID=1182444 RepID=A0AAU9D7W1_9BACT|nr:glycosyl hydrolase [Fulvitalea axinellae]